MKSGKKKNLVITGMPEEYLQTFLDMAALMELSRDQLLTLLMVNAGFIRKGLDAVIPERNHQGEWRELMVQRLFELTNL